MDFRSFTTHLAGSLVALAAAAGFAQADDRPRGPAVPVAVAWRDADHLAVALREGRQVAIVDRVNRQIAARHDLPFRPASLAKSPDLGLFVGGCDGEVAHLDTAGRARLLRAATGRGPVRLAALPGGRLALATLWDTALRLLDAADGREQRAFPLGFAPGAIVGAGGDVVLVASAFGDQLARVDTATGDGRIRSLDGFNLRALTIAPGGRDVLIGHMSQYGTSPLTATNLDWGLILSSRVSSVALADWETTSTQGATLPRVRVTLDGSGHGAADPAALHADPSGTRVYVALAGSNQVARIDRMPGPTANGRPAALGSSESVEVVGVGRNPVDLAVTADGDQVVTADAMADTLTWVDARRLEVVATTRLGPDSPIRTAAQRGEAWFVDGSLAMDRWMSCASCHPQGHTAGRNFDTLGDGGYGAAKVTPSLLGHGDTAPYGWTGRFARLEDQVGQSIATSLRGRSSDPETTADLVAYLRSLPAPPPMRDPNEPVARLGAEVFRVRKCDTCHAGPEFTAPGVKNVGLDDGPGGHNAFNPPALRGVGWSAPYLHDGRAADLDAVLRVHPPNAATLTPDERAALRAYLESL